jgi:hypothetical protein
MPVVALLPKITKKVENVLLFFVLAGSAEMGVGRSRRSNLIGLIRSERKR